MKLVTYSEGKFSQIKLDDGSRIFVQTLTDSIRVSNLILKGLIPTKTIWEFFFPFIIRGPLEAWDSSKIILTSVLDAIEGAKDLKEVNELLENDANRRMVEYAVNNLAHFYLSVAIEKGIFMDEKQSKKMMERYENQKYIQKRINEHHISN